MSDKMTTEKVKVGLESLGMWMESRYSLRYSGLQIQKWEMPRKEKEFFTFYAMNLVLESNGFDNLKDQEPADVNAFVMFLEKLGAKKTSLLVRNTLDKLKDGRPCDENKCTQQYYDSVAREKIWLSLLDHVGLDVYRWYLERAEQIENSGGNSFDPKLWQD
jgi:hypothetical protein